MIPKVKLSDKALFNQKKASIDTLNLKSQELQREVKALEKERTNVLRGISNILGEKRAVLEKKIGEADAKIVIASEVERKINGERKEIYAKHVELEKSIEEAKDRKDKAVVSINKAKDANRVEKVVIAEKASELGKKEKELIELKKSLSSKQDYLAVDAKEIGIKDAEVSAKITENEILVSKIMAEKSQLKDREVEVSKSVSKVLRLSAAMDQKESELIDMSKKMDKRADFLTKDKDKLNEEKTEIVVLKRKNEAEKIRLKNIEKEIVNKDAKLRDREKLFNTKIGGE